MEDELMQCLVCYARIYSNIRDINMVQQYHSLRTHSVYQLLRLNKIFPGGAKTLCHFFECGCAAPFHFGTCSQDQKRLGETLVRLNDTLISSPGREINTHAFHRRRLFEFLAGVFHTCRE